MGFEIEGWHWGPSWSMLISGAVNMKTSLGNIRGKGGSRRGFGAKTVSQFAELQIAGRAVGYSQKSS